MNQSRRETVAIALVAGAACAGAWFGLVEPAARSLAAQRDREAKLLAEVSTVEVASTDMALLVAAAEQARRESEALLDRSRIATDDLKLMRAINAIATRHGVRIERVQPSEAAAPGRPQSAPAAEAEAANAAPSPVRWNARAMDVLATGTYAGVLAMLDDMRRELGFTALRDVRLASLADPQRGEVLLELRAEHLAVSLAAVQPPAQAAAPEATR